MPALWEPPHPQDSRSGGLVLSHPDQLLQRDHIGRVNQMASVVVDIVVKPGDPVERKELLGAV